MPKPTKEEIEKYKTTFKVFDRDNSGSIDQKELRQIFDTAGVFVDEQELRKLLQTHGGTNRQIEFDEFLALITNPKIANQSQDKLQKLALDVTEIEQVFELSKSGNSLSSLVSVLRDAVPKLSQEQANVLIKFHMNQFDSLFEIQRKTVDDDATTIIRKVVAENQLPNYFGEVFGNPALGGFFAKAKATAGLTAPQIIAQLGLDYSQSPFIDENKQPKKLVYVIEAEMDVNNCLTPLDPRVREKIETTRDSTQDEDLKTKMQFILDHSYDCAVDDGSEISQKSKVKLAPPFTGTGFCICGTDLDGSNARFVQEIVAINRTLSNQFIPFPLGTCIYAVGDSKEKEFPIASWNGFDWVLHVNEKTLPKWVQENSSNPNATELINGWKDSIAKGIAKNPAGAQAARQDEVISVNKGPVSILSNATGKNIKVTEKGKLSALGEGKRDKWIVHPQGETGHVFSLQNEKNPARFLRINAKGKVSGNGSDGGRFTLFQLVKSIDEGWFCLRSVHHYQKGTPIFVGFDPSGEPSTKGSNTFASVELKFLY
eukprot:TRINITY_DN12538_c0_g1_i1.p1 TRINITY_DN12538_c0_g1~~TRINITY_DN12538_c0_g1_i1.p1  ORF type:complete len:542 (-),score=137.71 TRINITY_DN12538_c0_g1_i1:94-1719(-)